ncbi:carboxypeptidase regulatory-like domain-containing protein [Staphylococcus pseudintermedius]|nr:carboxypeptidase regulatory-like domain-containing protein [Staphylococcus pseudintermedius]
MQNSDEVAVKGVKVTLTKSDGSTMTTTTDEKGKYLFTGLENGEYTVKFSELPEGYMPTKTQAGGDTKLDSNGLESKVTINNANDYSVDLGIVKPEPQPEPEAKQHMSSEIMYGLIRIMMASKTKVKRQLKVSK